MKFLGILQQHCNDVCYVGQLQVNKYGGNHNDNGCQNLGYKHHPLGYQAGPLDCPANGAPGTTKGPAQHTKDGGLGTSLHIIFKKCTFIFVNQTKIPVMPIYTRTPLVQF